MSGDDSRGEALLKQAAKNIEAVRKANAIILLVGREGTPLTKVRLSLGPEATTRWRIRTR